jgi:hypothetical protein
MILEVADRSAVLWYEHQGGDKILTIHLGIAKDILHHKGTSLRYALATSSNMFLLASTVSS